MLGNSIFALCNALWIMPCIAVSQGAMKPTLTCTSLDYVVEGEDFVCNCLPSSPSHSASWPGHSTNSTLYVANINRTMNGTQYVCLGTSVDGVETGNTTYAVRVAYGPDEGSLSVTQSPAQVIVDGVTKVTLTCNTDVYPAAEYAWQYTNSKLLITCEERNVTSNQCTYIPSVNNTNHRVTCKCTNHKSYKLQIKETEPCLQYPPLYPPVILLEDSTTNAPEGFRLGLYPLDYNSRLKCEVKGGSPLVDSINFACDSPRHDDTPDVNGTGVVTSYITLTNLQDEDGNITCTCSATWAPRPKLYIYNTTAIFPINYGPIITSYSVKGTSVNLTTNENNTSVFLVCAAIGRPAPAVTIHDAEQIPLTNSVQSNQSQLETTAEAGFAVTDCSQTGFYPCTARNSLRNITNTISVNITCPPTWADIKSSIALPAVTKDSPLTFSLKANPIPSKFDFFYLNKTNASDAIDTTDVIAASCSPASQRPHYMAVCRVAVINAPSGIYNGTVYNPQGSFSFLLTVKADLTASRNNTTISPFIIVVSVTGPVVIVGVVVAIIVKCRRRAPRKEVNGNSYTSCRYRSNSDQGPRPTPQNYEDAWDLRQSPLTAALALAGEGNSEREAHVVEMKSPPLPGGSSSKAGVIYEDVAVISSSTPSPEYQHQNSTESTAYLIPSRDSVEPVYKEADSVTSIQHIIQ